MKQDKPANTETTYRVKSDLPISCPMPDMQTWNSHPRVFLTFNDSKKARCPYCSAEYHLIDT